MTGLWLLVWVISGCPKVVIPLLMMGESWNNWGIGLIVCILIDLLGLLK